MNENWLETLDEQGVQFVILDPCDDRDLAKAMRSQPGWEVDFEDREATIFARAGSRVGDGLGLGGSDVVWATNVT